MSSKECGVFEKTDEFKNIQKQMREVDCKLSYTFPRPLHYEGG